MIMEYPHLFLSGVGRSGTTALRRSLGEHSQLIYNGMENNIIQDLLEVASVNCTQPSRKSQMVLARDEYLHSFAELIRQLHWPVDELSRFPGPVWLTAAINLPVKLSGFLFEVFPSARMICLVRHGIAVVSSRMRYPSFSGDPFEQHCRVWLRSAETALWAGERRDFCRVFRQEWMADSDVLDSELKAIFLWLGISDEAVVREHLLKQRFHATVDSADGQAPLVYEQLDAVGRESFETQRRDRWRTWTDENRQVFERLCGDAMRRLGYAIPWL